MSLKSPDYRSHRDQISYCLYSATEQWSACMLTYEAMCTIVSCKETNTVALLSGEGDVYKIGDDPRNFSRTRFLRFYTRNHVLAGWTAKLPGIPQRYGATTKSNLLPCLSYCYLDTSTIFHRSYTLL